MIQERDKAKRTVCYKEEHGNDFCNYVTLPNETNTRAIRIVIRVAFAGSLSDFLPYESHLFTLFEGKRSPEPAPVMFLEQPSPTRWLKICRSCQSKGYY